MTDFVLDTEPLIVYLHDEPDASAVTEQLQAMENDEATGAISHVTATEVVYKIARLETGDPNKSPYGDDKFDVGEEDLHILQGYRVTIETLAWSTVAQIKAAGGISLGDAYAAALAREEKATLVVGADPEFGDLSGEIDYIKFAKILCELSRPQGVAEGGE